MKKTNSQSNSLDAPRLPKRLRRLTLPKVRPTKAVVARAALGAASPLTEHVKLRRKMVKDTAKRIPRYLWPLPEWTTTKPVLEDNVDADPTFSTIRPLRCVNLTDMVSRIGILKTTFQNQLNHVTTDRSVEPSVGNDTSNPLDLAPHPDSDFSHSDPGTYTPAETQSLIDAVNNVQNRQILARKDGAVAKDFQEALPTLLHARGLLAANAMGMQRLKLVFEWTLCHVTAIFGEINAALDASNKGNYNNAVERYVELLRDLDDHDPHTHPQGPPPPGERGYGITIKSSYIVPLIFGGRIRGATVETKWNPHMSSSGIPIPHE